MPRKQLIARYLPNRTVKAAEHRAGLLGLTRKKKPVEYWTPVEIDLLKKHYGTMPRQELIARYLQNRSVKQVDFKAGKLGLRRRRPATRSWSVQDLQLLRQHYGTMPNVALRSRFFPRVSLKAIVHRARRLGVRSREPAWTAAEDRLVKLHFGRVSYAELAASYLPHRTRSAVEGRAAKLGLTREAPAAWSAKESALLKKHYATHDAHQMARYLPGRTIAAIRGRVMLEGLQKERHVAWTADDDALLRQLYPRHGRNTRIPGHTPGSTRVHAQKLGLRVTRRKRGWGST